MLFDTLVQNGRSYDDAIDIVIEKCQEATDKFLSMYMIESAQNSYNDYMNDVDYTTYEGFVLTRKEEDHLIKNTQANPGVVGRIMRGLEEMIKNLIRWIKTVVAKIKAVFTKKQIEKKVSILEKIINKFPKLKNKKVQIEDPEPGIFKNITEKVKGLVAKIKAGKRPSQLQREIEEEEKKIKRIKTIKKAAVITVSVAVLLGLFHQYLNYRKMEHPDVIDESGQLLLEHTPNPTPEDLQGSVKLENVRAMVEREKKGNIFRFIKNVPSRLVEIINGMKNQTKGGPVGDMNKMLRNSFGFTKQKANKMSKDIGDDEEYGDANPVEGDSSGSEGDLDIQDVNNIDVNDIDVDTSEIDLDDGDSDDEVDTDEIDMASFVDNYINREYNSGRYKFYH